VQIGLDFYLRFSLPHWLHLALCSPHSQTATAIPSWLTEGNSQYRVWLRAGQLHIVPIPRTPAELMAIPGNLTRAPPTCICCLSWNLPMLHVLTWDV
jgi:hypothetical protein